jgi:hypothetical protein
VPPGIFCAHIESRRKVAVKQKAGLGRYPHQSAVATALKCGGRDVGAAVDSHAERPSTGAHYVTWGSAVHHALSISERITIETDAGILIDAFEAALKELGLSDRNDTAALVVAKHLISFAKAGVLDPVQLRDLTVKAVRERPSPAN